MQADKNQRSRAKKDNSARNDEIVDALLHGIPTTMLTEQYNVSYSTLAMLNRTLGIRNLPFTSEERGYLLAILSEKRAHYKGKNKAPDLLEKLYVRLFQQSELYESL